MNQNLANILKATSPVFIGIQNLPKGTDENSLAEFLWQRLGINVDPSYISTKDFETASSALIVLNRDCVADFLNRALKGQDFDGKVPRIEARKTSIIDSRGRR